MSESSSFTKFILKNLKEKNDLAIIKQQILIINRLLLKISEKRILITAY